MSDEAALTATRERAAPALDNASALRAAHWLCDTGWIDDRRADEGGDAWLAGVAEDLQDAVERWPEMPAAQRRLLGPYFRRGDGHVRIEVLWVEAKAFPLEAWMREYLFGPGPDCDLILAAT